MRSSFSFLFLFLFLSLFLRTKGHQGWLTDSSPPVMEQRYYLIYFWSQELTSHKKNPNYVHPKDYDTHVKYGHRPVWEETWKLHTFFLKIISWTESVNNITHLHSPLYLRNLTVLDQLFFSCPQGWHLGKRKSAVVKKKKKRKKRKEKEKKRKKTKKPTIPSDLSFQS